MSSFNNWGEGTSSGDPQKEVHSQEFQYDPLSTSPFSFGTPPFQVCPIDNSQSSTLPTTQSPAFNSPYPYSSSLSYNDTNLTPTTFQPNPMGNDGSNQLGMPLGHQASAFPVNQSTSLSHTPFIASNLHQCGGGVSSPMGGHSMWGSEHTPQGGWTTGSTTQEYPAMPSASWYETSSLPPTNVVPGTRRQRERKPKMHELPEQEDPDKERRRQLAVKEFKKRERVKKEKSELERVLADTNQEIDTMKQEIVQTRGNIDWYNQHMN